MKRKKNIEKKDLSNPIYSIDSRPSFDEYFMYLAFAVSVRSDDLFQKIGAVIVHENSQHIVGTGYNNTIRGMTDKICRPKDRNYRRRFMKHAEDNAIKNCVVHPLHSNSVFKLYITAKPCLDCLEDVINFGIKHIIYLDRIGTITDSGKTDKIFEEIEQLYTYKGIRFDKFDINNPWVVKGIELLKNTELN